MATVSIAIIAHNEEARIGDALRSARWADEIIVVDSFSDDNTVMLARSAAAKVYQRAFDDFSSQKNFALSRCSSDWIFVLDCDECISPALRDSIKRMVAVAPSHSAYTIRRVNELFGKRLTHATSGDYQIRFFKKGSAHFIHPVHEVAEVCGSVGVLCGDLVHCSTPDLESAYRKMEHYTDTEARWMIQQGVRPLLFKMILYPILIFLNILVLKRGFMDGYAGLVYAFISAQYFFIKYAKARRIFVETA